MKKEKSLPNEGKGLEEKFDNKDCSWNDNSCNNGKPLKNNGVFIPTSFIFGIACGLWIAILLLKMSGKI